MKAREASYICRQKPTAFFRGEQRTSVDGCNTFSYYIGEHNRRHALFSSLLPPADGDKR